MQGHSFLTSRNFTNAYTHDAASNRTGFITDPEGGSTAYSYDTFLWAGYKYSPHPELAHLSRSAVSAKCEPHLPVRI